MSAPPPSEVCDTSQHVTSSKLSPALVVGLQCCLPAVGLADAHATQVAAIAAGEQEGGKVGGGTLCQNSHTDWYCKHLHGADGMYCDTMYCMTSHPSTHSWLR